MWGICLVTWDTSHATFSLRKELFPLVEYFNGVVFYQTFQHGDRMGTQLRMGCQLWITAPNMVMILASHGFEWLAPYEDYILGHAGIYTPCLDNTK